MEICQLLGILRIKVSWYLILAIHAWKQLNPTLFYDGISTYIIEVL